MRLVLSIGQYVNVVFVHAHSCTETFCFLGGSVLLRKDFLLTQDVFRGSCSVSTKCKGNVEGGNEGMVRIGELPETQKGVKQVWRKTRATCISRNI